MGGWGGGGENNFEKLRWKEGGGAKNCAFRQGCVESSGITHSYLYAIVGVVITLVHTVNMQ